MALGQWKVLSAAMDSSMSGGRWIWLIRGLCLLNMVPLASRIHLLASIQLKAWRTKTSGDQLLKEELSRNPFDRAAAAKKAALTSLQELFGTPLPTFRMLLFNSLNLCAGGIALWHGGAQPLRFAALSSAVALARSAIFFSIVIPALKK
jgi:hypothetical protein